MNRMIRSAAVLVVTAAAICASVRTDYDRNANFSRYRTYSWIEVEAQNSLWDDRIRAAVDQQLAARGWKKVPAGGDASVAAYNQVVTRERLYTTYSDPGWGWGWGGGFGTAFTQVVPEEVNNFTVDIFDAATKKLIWRGSGTKLVSSRSKKNIHRLNDVVKDMFKRFPTGKD